MEHDFQDGNGPVPAHQHPKGGGWVADTATVSETAFVGRHATVCGEAEVSEYARVAGYARVSGYAQVSGWAEIHDYAEVSGRAKVFGNARICGQAKVYGRVEVCGVAEVSRYLYMSERVEISGPDDFRTGACEGYSWTLTFKPELFLQFGCTGHPVAEWREVLREECEYHAPNRVEEFVEKISDLLDMAEKVGV